MKVTRKKIKEIISYTPDELRGKQVSDFRHLFVGHYTPTNSNWSYQISVVEHRGEMFKVVSVFGQIQ